MKKLYKKNPESYILNSKSKLGFTLVELLAVIFVFVIVGSIILAIIVSSLRGNNKTNALNNIESNGDYAITQVAKAIRDATILIAPFPCGTVNSPTVTNSLKLGFPDGTTSTYSCLDSSGNSSITSNSAALVDTNSINVTSCSFTCGQDAQSSYPIIGINFSLKPLTSSNFAENTASASAVQFTTSVVLRNLIR